MSPITALLQERHKIEPISIGPTWQRNPDWDGVTNSQRYVLPKLSLGWAAIEWIQHDLQSDDYDEYGRRCKFALTFEQKRFLLWWYEIDSRGVFVYRDGVLQRLKGWGLPR